VVDVTDENDVKALLANPEPGILLINVRSVRMMKLMVDILRTLLKDMQQKGVVLTIDRPHTYIQKLLEKQGIPQDKLMYLDAVLNISGEKTHAESNLELLSSPFCVNLLYEAFSSENCRETIKRSGFIFVDNLSVLQTYVTDNCIENFLNTVKKLGENAGSMKCILFIDREAHTALFDIVKKIGAREVEL
jgi:hypothetical protein